MKPQLVYVYSRINGKVKIKGTTWSAPSFIGEPCSHGEEARP